MRYLTILFYLLLFTGANAQQTTYNILDYGARADKNVINTKAIQQAIDQAALRGGGKVIIPDGNFITGPVNLKSGVELHFSDNAVLLGSVNRLDYGEYNARALISAIGQTHIGITGSGLIDGRGRELVENVLYLLRKNIITDPQWKIKRPVEKNRPPIISFYKCSNITLSDITIKDASGWVQSYSNCTDIVIDKMKVQSTAYWNNDGIDIVDSKNVKITNSIFNAADDAICLKSESPAASCENIIIENCTVRSSASGFKLGTGSVGGFKHIKVNNLTVYDTYRSAIALEAVDGAFLEDIDIRNVTATNTGNALFLRLGHRNTEATYGDPMTNSRFSDRWIEDGSYLRLRTLTGTYSFPINGKGNIKGLKIYVTGTNLLTFTKYLGYDPEFSATESVFTQGIDTGLEPQFRSVQIGVRLSL